MRMLSLRLGYSEDMECSGQEPERKGKEGMREIGVPEEGQNAVDRENSLRKWEMTPDLKKGRRLAERNFPSSTVW